jgi:hypothetical protein
MTNSEASYGRKPTVQIATIDGLTVDAAVVLRLHFLYCMKSQADWDMRFGRRSKTSIWSTHGKNSA